MLYTFGEQNNFLSLILFVEFMHLKTGDMIESDIDRQ